MKVIAGLTSMFVGFAVCIYGLSMGNLIVGGLGIIVVITGFKVLTS
jgi:hypothetical protein